LLTIIFFWPVLFQGKTFYALDTLLQYLPWSSSAPNFRAHNPLITDPVNLGLPFHYFIKNSIGQKALPLWNGLNLCGNPLSAGGLSQYSSPIALFYLLFPLSIAHDLLLWFLLVGSGLFMFCYLKKIDLNIYPALIGSISWMFNGYIMVWFEFEITAILSFSLSASMYFIECWLKSKTKFHFLCFVCAMAFAIGSGFPHILIYQFLFLGIYILYRYFQLKREDNIFRKIGKKDWLYLGAAALAGICISATFFISHLSLFDDLQRQAFSFTELFQKTGQLPVKYLTTLIFPDFFGSPPGNICFTPRVLGTQSYNNYNELCIYAGILPLMLALCCLPYCLKRKHILFFTFTAIIPLTMAMGSVLYYPMAKYIPGLNLSTPTRILYIFGFSISVLAAIGADILTTDKEQKKGPIFTLCLIVVAITATIAFFVQTETGIKWATSSSFINWTNANQVYTILGQHFDFSSGIILKPILIVLLSFLLLSLILFAKKEFSKTILMFFCVILLSYDLLSFGLFYNTASPRSLEYPATDAIRFLQKDRSEFRIISFGNFMHNSFAPFMISDIGGYSPFYPKRYGEFLHLSQYGKGVPFPDNFSRWVSFQKFGSPLIDLINTKYLLMPASYNVEMPKLNLVYDNEIKIYENNDAFPRAFFVPEYQFCRTQKEAYETLAAYTIEDFRKKVILESLPPMQFRLNNKPFEHETSATIDMISYKPDKIEMQVSADRKGFLIISDNYHPAWQAKVDGIETEVLRANYIMRAIPITAGNHKVSLIFCPKLLKAGLVITAIGWIILIILMISSVHKRKNNPFLSERES
jgi:hypothetical protein